MACSCGRFLTMASWLGMADWGLVNAYLRSDCSALWALAFFSYFRFRAYLCLCSNLCQYSTVCQYGHSISVLWYLSVMLCIVAKQFHNDFVTNRAVADSTNLPSILSTIAARRQSFFSHIRRLPANTPAHKALKLAVDSRSGDIPHHDWNCPAGRPRTTWMSQIVRDTGLTAADAWALADNRTTWRALLPTAGYAQQWVSEWVSEWVS